MANLAKQTTIKKNPAVAGDIVALTMTAGTTTGSGGDLIDITGDVVIIAQNTSTDTAYDIVINGEPDSKGRDVSITKELAAGAIVPICVSGEGWQTAGGKLSVSVENAAIKWGAFADPN